VVLLPGALSERGPEIGVGFAAALTLGSGQFCTNPGLVVAIDGPELDRFIEGAAAALQGIAANPMLTKGIRQSYRRSLESQGIQADVVTHVAADAGEGNLAGASLRSVSAATFMETLDLHQEVFGPASLLVRCRDEDEICRVLESLEGQLTAAVHIGGGDERLAAAVLPILERKAGRILANGFGTGVEVASAMVHGGPWPATSDGRSTSVGTLAIDRFLRPISYQDWPQDLLPNDFAVT
jgi:alpha-ketoglutaric semialdehyde dehydrogenase